MTTKALTWLGMAIFLLVILVPFWWIASMSFKTYEQIQFATSIYVPNPFTWENYTGLWTETRFPLWLRNSLVTALVVTATPARAHTPLVDRAGAPPPPRGGGEPRRLRGGAPALPRARVGGEPDP